MADKVLTVAEYRKLLGKGKGGTKIRTDPYKSDVERRWAREGHLHLIAEFWEGRYVAETVYEGVSFSVAGGRFKPDFFLVLDSPEDDIEPVFCFVEVKGRRPSAQRNYRDSRSKLRAAAERYPWFYFYQAHPVKGGRWEIEPIPRPLTLSHDYQITTAP